MSEPKSKREFNDEMIQPYVDKLIAMVKYNRDKLKNEKDYRELSEEDRLKHIQIHPEYKEFYMSFPSVTTTAICRGVYSTKVFKKYIKYKFTKTPTAEERAELSTNPEGQMLWANQLYATYMKWLYAEKVPKCPQNELNRVYNEYLDALNSDIKKDFQTYEKEKAKFDLEKEKLNQERKNELKDLFKKRLEKKLNNDNENELEEKI